MKKSVPSQLTPLNRMDPAKKFAIQSKGGKTVTDKQRRAFKLRGIKTRIKNGNYKNVDGEYILKLLEDPAAMDAEILMFAEHIKDKLHPMQRVAFLNALSAAKRSIHGDKVTSTNLNVNIDVEEWERRMMSDDE